MFSVLDDYSKRDSAYIQTDVGCWNTEFIYISIATYSRFLFRWNFISTPKLNTLQLNTVSNSPNTRARPTSTISEKELTSLQSGTLQTHVRTIHRRVMGPLAHQNSTPAYSPSLNCRLLALTIDCLHNSRDPQAVASLSHCSLSTLTRIVFVSGISTVAGSTTRRSFSNFLV
jgi:hypothetical protein